MDERERITRALAGDGNAERALYDAHVDRVYRLAYRLAGDPDLAEDFTQETFLRAFRRLGSFRGDAALSTWLHAIAVSVSITGLRKQGRRRKHEVRWDDAPLARERGTGDDVALRRRLADAIDSLPDRLRIVFIMYFVEGYKHREIAAVLDIPEGTSKARLSRAREQLRDRLGHPGTEAASGVELGLSHE